MKFTTIQPKDGDVILICAHQHRSRYHWYALNLSSNGESLPLEMQRPDGSTGKAKFACVCDTCNREPDPLKLLTGERIWTGDDPAVFTDDSRQSIN